MEKLRSLRDELASARTTSRDVRTSVDRTQSALQALTRRAVAAEQDADKLRNHLAAVDEQVGASVLAYVCMHKYTQEKINQRMRDKQDKIEPICTDGYLSLLDSEDDG